jgi:phage major head subunit gpT-like protein
MVLNRENLNALSRSFRALTFEAREGYQPLWSRIAAEVPSEGRANYYAWLESLPQVRAWVGERQVQNLTAQVYALENEKFEMTVAVKRDDVEDDQVGLYAPLFRQLGLKAAEHDDQLIFTLLKEGFTRKAYDGLAFFATNHKIGKQTVSNRGAVPLTRENFRAALAQMRSLTDEKGSPLGFFYRKPIYLVVGPALESTALEIVGVQTLPAGGANPDYQAAEILLSPWLVGGAEPYWFLLDGAQALRPFVLQRRSRPEWVQKEDPETSDEVFARDVIVYGLRERKAAGYLFWQLAYGSTGS